jgi:hypothetical protein
MRILGDALTMRPALESVRDDVQAAASKLLKATRSGDTLRVGDIQLDAAEAHELAQPERELAKDVEISGEFFVISNRTDIANGFRITVKSVENGDEFRTDVPLELPQLQRDAIREAEWAKSRVRLDIAGESLRGQIIRATVISAAAIGSQA